MMLTSLVLAALAATSTASPTKFCLASRQTGAFVPRPGFFPATGDDTIAGGIFCISLGDLGTYLARVGNNPGATGAESPRGGGQTTTGSGPYPAQSFSESALPKHTIFAPRTPPPAGVSMPVIAWGNGGCATDPSTHRNLLLEIASHWYVVIADGVAGGRVPGGQSQMMVADMKAAITWAVGGGAAKFGNANATGQLATMGHSCGGLEAMSAGYRDERVKRIVLLNIGIFQDERRYLLEQIKVPVAWFVGGPKDMGYPNAEKDYKLLPAGVPAYKANLDTGHGGTFAATNGGKQGKAVVSYLQWQFRGDEAAKARLLDPKAPGSLVSDNWTVEFKNW